MPQTVGTIWHDIFDDVSTAYHKKVAKDRANEEGLVVNPPDHGNLPGEGEVTYASQVKDVLIPYTTREDTFHYYEERNYVNDVNREHTEVLQTYDRELKAKETYTYGQGRSSYLNNETGDQYQYMTNQAGSVTGLTKDGSPVASTSYNLYGLTKETTDTTGNPFAYNGEARDVTGLDYLRARYYDSSAGTFLTEDSYQGELTVPLSQNRYSYVHNNPVNYTDPSGHFLKAIGKGLKWVGNKLGQAAKWVGNKVNQAVNWVGNKVNQAVNWIGNQVNSAKQWVGEQWQKFTQSPIYQAGQHVYQSASDYVETQHQQVQAQIQAQRHQQIREEYQQTTGIKGTPKSREGQNLLRNWGEALAKTCESAQKAFGGTTVSASTVKFDQSHSAGGYEFKQNLMKQYGFDQTTSDLMWNLYQNIKVKEGKNADYAFNRLMGGAQYAGFKWDNTAGSTGEVREVLHKYGMTESDADKLVYNIRIQYLLSSGTYGDLSSLKKQGLYESFKSSAQKAYPDVDFDQLWNSNYTRYSSKTDFAHQSITTATHLYNKPRLADIYGVFVGGTNALAGWRGDVTKDAEASPSMGNDDYRADLDTVNITSMMQKNKMDYISASNLYYDGISSGAYTRANVFKQNISLADVKKAIYSSLVPSKTIDLGPNIQSHIRRSDAESMEYLRINYPTSYNFIRSLEAGTNDLQDYISQP